ncbi:hypothetical protein CRE_31217 [Caenorhabditis remanei]|uniref:Uncharacterized protein n=1 Tax=Caenorhabditis remanei TaxID=31234 RepID=E3MLM4_CAERE|nr:hypothetical protein CRE_31217 [Caenorhabditis remanei]
MKLFMILCCLILLVLLPLPSHSTPLQTTDDARFQNSMSSVSMFPHTVNKRNVESEEMEVAFEWQTYLNYAFHNNESLVLEVVNKFPAHVTFRCCDEMILETVSPITNGSIALGPYWVEYLRQLVHEERCYGKNKLIIVSTPAEQPSSSFDASFNLTRFKGCVKTQNALNEFEEVNIRQDANRVGLYNVQLGGIVSRALTPNGTEQMVIKMGSGGPIKIRFTKCNLLLSEIITINDNGNHEVDEKLLLKMRMLDQTVCGTKRMDSGLSVMVISDRRLVTTLIFHLQPRTTTTQPPLTTTTETPAFINVDETGVVRFSDWIGEGKVGIDLRDILDTSSNFMLMLEIDSTEPISFSLEKQHRALIGRSIPFSEERFYFSGPWIPHLSRLSEVVTPDEVHNFTLQFSTYGKKASGHFRFSKSERIKTQDAGRNTKEIVNIHQDSMHPVVYYLALGKLIGDAIQNQSLTLRLNSSLSEMATVGFGKCETIMMTVQLNATDSVLIDNDLLEHMDRMNNMFCILDRNLGRFVEKYTFEIKFIHFTFRFDLAVSSPTPVTGTLHFGFNHPIAEEEPIPVIPTVSGIIFGLLAAIGLCVFLVRRHRNRARIVLRRNKPATVFENRLSTVHYNTQSHQIDFSAALGPIEELDDAQSDSGAQFEKTDSIKLKKMNAVDRVHYRTERLQEMKLSSGSNTIRSIQLNRPYTSILVENDVYGNNAAVSDVVQPNGEIDGEEVEIDETELYVHDDSRVFFA